MSPAAHRKTFRFWSSRSRSCNSKTMTCKNGSGFWKITRRAFHRPGQRRLCRQRTPRYRPCRNKLLLCRLNCTICVAFSGAASGNSTTKFLINAGPKQGAMGLFQARRETSTPGDFDLLLTSRLSNRASVLSEMVFEEADAQKFRINLHWVLLKYDYNDHLKMSFGRYQTNIGYYNWAFRSAAWLQTTADRPLIMEFASNGGLHYQWPIMEVASNRGLLPTQTG